MRAWGWLLAVSLSLPAAAGDKGKKEAPKPPERKGASVEDLLSQADQRVAAGDLDGAAELLRKAVALAGPSGEPSLRLGRLLEGRYELDAAIDAYMAAAEKLAGAAKGEALGRLSVLQEIRGSAEAAATAEAATAADPDGPWPAIALGRARARQGKGDEAVALARKAEAAGGGAAAGAALGYAQEAHGDLAAAEAAYRGAMAAGEGVAQSLGLARVLRRTSRAAEAEPVLQNVLEKAPGAIEAYKESARVKLALNRPTDAMGDAATAAALAEGDAEAQRLVQEVTVASALAHLATNQVDLAVEELTAYRDRNPGSALARVGLANALVAQRRADAAIAELQKAIELEPGSAEAHFQLGFVSHVLKRDAAAALGPYEKAVAADSGNVEYRTNLGAVLSDLKQFDRAAAELTKVTESPGYARVDAWIYLGAAHLGAKRYKEAIPALERAVAIAPASAQAEAYLGWCYFGLKDAESFKKHAGRARALGHKEPTLLQYLSRVEAGEPIK